MSILIRDYKPSDNEFILSLASRLTEFELPEWRHKQEIDHTNLISLKQALDQPEPDSAIFIAETENRTPTGFIHLQTQTDTFSGEKFGYISDLAVESSFEGQGLGRRLLDAAEHWASAKGYRLLALYVFAGNRRAQQVYEKFGFRQEVLKYVKVV